MLVMSGCRDSHCVSINCSWFLLKAKNVYRCSELHSIMWDSFHFPGNRTHCYDEVDLSLCFEDSAIFYGIVALFWFLALFLFFFALPTLNGIQKLPFGLLHSIKIFLLFVSLGTGLIDMVYAMYQGFVNVPVALYQYVTPVILAVTMVSCFLLMYKDRIAGVRSSGLLLCFWLGLVVYGSIKLRTLLLLSVDNDGIQDKFRFTTFVLQYATYVFQLLFSLFQEPKSKDYTTIHDSERHPSPEIDASFLSRITWWWQNELIWLGWRRSLIYDDLSDLKQEDKCTFSSSRFQKQWGKEKSWTKVKPEGKGKTSSPSLIRALIKTFWRTFIVSGIFKLVQDLLTFVGPQVLKLMIRFTYDTSEPPWHGYMYAVLLFLATVVQSLVLHQYFHRCFTLGIQMRSAIIAAIYSKSLKLSSKARRITTAGEIVNLMAVDAQRFMDLMPSIHLIWSAPLQIVLSLVFLYISMGPSIFAGVAVMLLLIPLNVLIATYSKKLQGRQMIFKDSRLKLINEVLSGIQVVKLYAWELPFKGLITVVRDKELNVLKMAAYCDATSLFTVMCAPFLISLATFSIFSLINLNNPNENLTAEKAFVALSLFNILRYPLSLLPKLIALLVQATVSIERVRTFLNNDELDTNAIKWSTDHCGTGSAVSMKAGTFSWDTKDRNIPTLSGVDFEVMAGELVAVVGTVGAGKSSLIQALLGEMDKTHGQVSIKGQVAYVSQQAWIQNTTLRDNILFGKQMNGVLYNECLYGCALEPDLQILPGGDLAEIGEKGINLSGGQKQRVSLARAVYQEADVYLLDDPLSAVDSHVGKHIFEKVIGPKGTLRKKARVLVTHGMRFLPQCDKIVVMVDGEVTEVGTYNELIKSKRAFADFLMQYSSMDNSNREQKLGSKGKLLGSTQARSKSSKIDDGEIGTEMSVLKSGIGSENIRDDDRIEKETALDGALDSDIVPDIDVASGTFTKDLGAQWQKVGRMGSVGGGHSSVSPTKSQEALSDGVNLLDQSSQEPLLQETTFDDNPMNIRSDSFNREHRKNSTSLMTKEKPQTGAISLSVIFTYIRACTWILSVLSFIVFALTSVTSISSNFWLAKWSNAEEGKYNTVNFSAITFCDHPGHPNVGCYIGFYAGLGFCQTVFMLCSSFTIATAGIRASRSLHSRMLANILQAPMSFFDTTPTGRILNRFSKDVQTIDDAVPRSLRSFLHTLFSVISTVVVIFIVTPTFGVVIIPLGIFYLLTQRFYIATSRQLKRLESITRSPIYSHFQETITGASTIRAYRKQERFVEENQSRVDYNVIAYYPSICANRWLAIRIGLLGNLLVFFAALFATLHRNFPDVLPSINASLVGLSISYSLQVTRALDWLVRKTSELETNIVSIERVKEYTETPTEAPRIVESRRPPHDWPDEGHIKFDYYSTRYREGLDPVLTNISVEIPGGAKVGIVGRTGAGKSSFTLAIFRIIEAVGGAILVDNINIEVLGLEDLRSRITIIPQDPVLFSGSLRMNLDPFDAHTDHEIWSVLESAHFNNFVTGMKEGLHYDVTEGGDNLSIGQRQLVCLARALLRKTKILVLDEATAAMDLETDDRIQKTIRTEFADCTVLTIAHRLNTIMDYDRVIVIDGGRIAEYDSPMSLLSNQNSIFYSMAKDTGL